MESCLICGKQLRFSWTDTHGIAQCLTCGAPYRILHYAKDTNERIDKPPQICIAEIWIPICKAYWEQNKKRMPSGYSFTGGQDLATREEAEIFGKYCIANNPEK